MCLIFIDKFRVSYNQITPDKVLTKVKTTSNSNAQTSISQWGYLLNINSETTNKTTGEITTTVQKGIILSKASYKMEARLFIMNINNTPQMVWRSSSTTSGYYLVPNSKVLQDAANNIAKQLSNEVWEID